MISMGLMMFLPLEGSLCEDLKFKGELEGLEDASKDFGGLNVKFGKFNRVKNRAGQNMQRYDLSSSAAGHYWRRTKKTGAVPS